MIRRAQSGAASTGPLIKTAAGFLVVGLFLFLHVWIPVQAERSQLELKKLESQLFRAKSELDELDTRYAALTALPVLDQWAKTHGPWVTPNGSNVVAIQD
jgi:hypothetical protein